MKRPTAVDDARLRLDARRRRLETELQGLQDDMRHGLGWAPKGSGALLLGLATAAGFAVAVGLRRLRR